MPQSPPPIHKDQSQSRYLRLLKRRQRTSLWLERLTAAAVLVALACFLDEQVTRVLLVWWLGMGCLLLALLFILIEAIDASIEEKQRKRHQQTQRNES